MATGDIKTFDYVYAGLTLKIDAIDNGDGTVKFVVTCVSGSADINALYWSDGDATANEGTFTGLDAKKDASLNMNGTGEAWDGGLKLSSAGIGPQGLDKPTYLQTGETYVVENAALNWDTLDTLGVRATSTSTAGGSIKGVDGDAVVTECPHVHINDVTVTEGVDGNAVFTVSIEEAYLYDVVVSYTTANGTAGSSDYTTTSGTVTILAGQLSASTTISVPILDDSTPESTETFVVNLTHANAVLPGDDLDVTDCIADSTGIGTILDTDVGTPPPGNDPPASPAIAKSQGFWSTHDGVPNANEWDAAQTDSFETTFGVSGPFSGSWDLVANVNNGTPLVADITLKQAMDINPGSAANHLALEATTALLNLAENDLPGISASFKEWYIYERKNFVAADTDADNDLTGATDAQILADLKTQVQDAFNGAPDAYTMTELTNLLLLTHE